MSNKVLLIDANALLAKFERIAKKSGVPHFHLDEIADEINEADAVELVHGVWKYYHKQNIAVCMNCSFERNLDANFGKAVSCPNCGAKMGGDGNV